MGPILALASPAHADDLRSFCPDRPGRGSPPCVIDEGKVQAEMSFFDVTHDTSNGVTDTVIVGDLLLRYGVTRNTELTLGWTPYGHVRSRDPLSGAVSGASSTGDVSLGFKTSLRHPDGSGFSVALAPSVVIPTGGSAIGSGGWGANLTVPITLPLTSKLQLALTPTVGVTPDASGDGRHLTYGGVVGLGVPLTPLLNAGVEVAGFQDDEPANHTLKSTLDLNCAWNPKGLKDIQFDAGINLGLNSQTAKTEIIFGIAHRF